MFYPLAELKKEQGSVMLEAIICLPFLFLLVFLTAQLAHISFCRQVVQYAAVAAGRATISCADSEEKEAKELFDFFDGCELKDLSFINEIDRHAAKIELTPYLLGAISDESVEPMFDCIAKKQKVKALRVAIMILPDKQRRRLLMYYWGDMTYAQIAAIEGCSFQSVMKSLNAAKKNLKVMLKDYN